jgi:hypothetical protein
MPTGREIMAAPLDTSRHDDKCPNHKGCLLYGAGDGVFVCRICGTAFCGYLSSADWHLPWPWDLD